MAGQARRAALGTAAAAAMVAAGGLPAATAAGPERAPLIGAERATAIDGSYIVVMKDSATQADRNDARAIARSGTGTVTKTYSNAVSGFSARLSERALDRLRTDPDVAFVEANQRISIDATQSNPTWGLDRIDQRALPLSASYTYTATGSGVTAYIIDTGIRSGHADFGGRVSSGYTAINDGRGTEDCNGHGTHVAGTVGGSTYGVAKQVGLRPVRVLGCDGSGTTEGVIAGVDWVASNHSAGAPAVANMSLGGGVSTALDNAVAAAINDGVTFVAAAGNDYGANACNSSPARVGAALTVGSSTRTDARSSFSNIGSCLDLFAPGSDITSAWHTSNTATNTISGTSMAAPHVAGAAALILQGSPSASPATVSSAIIGAATPGVVSNTGSGSPNRLLYTGTGGATEPPVDPPTGNVVANPGFESGSTGWTATSGVIDNSTGAAARSGSWKAWLNGYGRASTNTLSQNVTVPTGSSSLRFWLRVSTAETGSTAYDRLSVQVVSGGTTTTLATYSNANASSSYVQRTFNLSAYAGRTVTLRFTGTEDSSLATSFLIDDVSVTSG